MFPIHFHVKFLCAAKKMKEFRNASVRRVRLYTWLSVRMYFLKVNSCSLLKEAESTTTNAIPADKIIMEIIIS